MRKSKRILLVIAVMLVLAMMTAMLVSCSSYYTLDEAYDKMQAAIEESANKTNYFNSIKYVDGYYEQVIRFQIIPDDPNTELHETMIQFADITTASYGAKPVENYYRFGYALSKDVKKSKAKPSDYKPYRFFNSSEVVDSDKNQIRFAEPYTTEEFMLGEKSGLFNPETKAKDKTVKYTDLATKGLLDDLDTLEKSSITDNSKSGTNGFKKAGSVETFNFKVSQEGHKYDGLALEVVLLNDKVHSIRYTQANGIKVQIDLIFNSPKLQLPAYDAKGIRPYSESNQ